MAEKPQAREGLAVFCSFGIMELESLAIYYHFMGVPRQRKTKSERNQRRSHHSLTRVQLAKCKNCGVAVMPHQVCGNCGYYRGRQIRTVAAASSKTST